MSVLRLPDDLAAFLVNGRQLEYDPKTCRAGVVTMVAIANLNLERFPMETHRLPNARQDVNYPLLGSYLVTGINLTATCEHGYDAVGLLLWLPIEHRYATWDDSHAIIRVFLKKITWEQIAADPAPYINAQWTGRDPSSRRLQTLKPWPTYPYSVEPVYGPQPF